MYPSYLNLSKKELNQRIEKLFKNLKNCQICPRKCRVNRIDGEKGFCGLGVFPVVSTHHSHFGEEDVLVGTHGSGTIFFTSCNLACIFCQNYEISQLRIGEKISFERLTQIMINLQKIGCHSINLVSPTSHIPAILKALSIARERGLKLPLVYNTNTYDSVKTLKLLDGIIDIYMPDTKYSDNEVALKYSNAPNYFEIMKAAIKEMYRQVGDLILDYNPPTSSSRPAGQAGTGRAPEKGIAVKGLLVRHLVLPNNLAGTKKIVEFLAKTISKNTFLNIMNQYYPSFKASQYPELSRRISQKEFEEAINLAKKVGLRRLYHE